MRHMRLWVLLLAVAFYSCNSDDDNPIDNTSLDLLEVFPEFVINNPVDMQVPGDGSDRLFVVEKTGRIKVIQNSDPPEISNFLNLSGQLSTGSEQGLLGLAFHPEFSTNGYFFINYNPDAVTTRVSRFSVSATDENQADMNSEVVLLSFFQDAQNHNGGQLAFGPDNYLYISSGDGGNENNAQDLSNLTGTILRIDVDNPENGENYGIPDSNPFVDDLGARNEIYAYGFRNPWRMSFDGLTGELYAGDVGLNQREEIDIVESGGNYGWRMLEGTACRIASCDGLDTVAPIFEYEHQSGTSNAITGGYVYRGSLNPELSGKYIYGDFARGLIWALDPDTGINETLFETDLLISSFGTDAENELYVLDFSGSVYYFGRSEIMEPMSVSDR